LAEPALAGSAGTDGVSGANSGDGQCGLDCDVVPRDRWIRRVYRLTPMQIVCQQVAHIGGSAETSAGDDRNLLGVPEIVAKRNDVSAEHHHGARMGLLRR